MLTSINLLKFDTGGALLTSLITGGMFVTRVVDTGMPRTILVMMMLTAALLCGFGLYGLVWLKEPSRTLRWLAYLNLCFCVFSAICWWSSYDQLTTIGRIYFPGEVLVVMSLAILELRVASQVLPED